MRDDEQQPAAAGTADADLPHPAQLAVGLVSAGRAGTAMAVALTRAGHRVVAASAVSRESLSRVSRSLPAARVVRPDDADKMTGISFGVTAPEPLRPVAEALVVEMGGEPVFIAEDKRGIYHAALASAANHLVTLVAASIDLLSAAGVPDPPRMLGPLLGAALENVLALGDLALTGPVARGDAETVAAHVEVIAAVAPEALGAYLVLARLTADRALAAGILTSADAQRLLGVLSGPAG